MKFWNKYHRNYIHFQKQSFCVQNFIAQAISNAQMQESTRVLDVGCGNGVLLEKLNNYNVEVTGLDFSVEAIALAKERTPKAHFINHDLRNNLPFLNSYFDTIFCLNTLYVLGENGIRQALSEIYRILKPGGVFILSDPLPNFSNISIFITDTRYTLNEFGYIKGIYKIFSNIILYIKVLFYNIIIDRRANNLEYYFMTSTEYIRIITECGFKVIRYETAYNNQNNLLVATKEND